MEPSVEYLRGVLAKVQENSDFWIYVRAEDWARYLTWSLDQLEDCRKARVRKSTSARKGSRSART